MSYELNAEAIQEAAESCAAQLVVHGFAEYILSPGDATAYPFVILPAGRVVDATGASVLKRNYNVILASGYGAAYEWTGDAMHADYCGDKWATSSRYATGNVVAAFLTALSPLVESVR